MLQQGRYVGSSEVTSKEAHSARAQVIRQTQFRENITRPPACLWKHGGGRREADRVRVDCPEATGDTQLLFDEK